MNIEMIGQILAGGWGDKVFIGTIIGFLNNVTPMRCYEYIRDNLELAYWIDEEEWNKYRKMAKGANISTITIEEIIEGLRKYRTDLLGVIVNDPQGMDWLQKQVSILRERLGLG